MEIEHCTCCGKELKPAGIKWLELNSRTNKWSDPEARQLPAEVSQGTFPFGLKCAEKLLAEQH
jgi:hypothetical protein